MRRRSLVVMVLLGCTLVASYARGGNGLLKVGDRPPPLEFKPYKSQELVDWSGLKNRVVVVEFWATWCAPCIENIPHINDLVRKFALQPVTFISVTYETEGMVGRFLKEHPLSAMIGLDNDFAMFRSFKAWGIPMAVIVNRKGRIACVLHPDNLSESVIDEVLAGKAPRVEPARPWPDPKGAEQYFRSLVKKAGPDK